MKKLLAVTAILVLAACGSLTDPHSLNRWVDEATYKHYPNLSEAKRAECRAVGDDVYWEERQRWQSYQDSGRARVPAANAFEACMEAK